MNAVTSNMSRTRAAVFTVLTACVAVTTCATAYAGESCATGTATAHSATAVTVTYGDLNLSTHEGATALYARINHAAHKVCSAGNIRDLGAWAAAQGCQREAIAQAVRTVHSAQLASLVGIKLPQG